VKFCEVEQMKLNCDNQTTLLITFNSVYHERTKHIEISCYFIREKLLSKELFSGFISSNDQLAYILIKFLRGLRIQLIYSKLGAYNLYAPA